MKQSNVQGRYPATDLSNYNQNNFVLYNKDYNRTNKISTSKAKTKNNLKNQFALNTKFSRYNSADKYKLSNYKSKPLINKFDEIVSKSKKNFVTKDKVSTNNQMYFYPNQINININNYNFSNYNNKSLNQRLQNASNTQTDSRLSNIIQNNNNSPAYIEIINPIPNKSNTNSNKEKEKYNSFNRAANKQPSSFKNSNINFNQLEKLNESIIKDKEREKPAVISNSTTQLPRTTIDQSKKIIINKSLQKKILEINQTTTNPPEINKKIKIGNYEIDNENESFFHDVINLFQDTNDKKERYSSYKDEVNQKSPNEDKNRMPLIQMNKSKITDKSTQQVYHLQGSLNDKNVYLDNVRLYLYLKHLFI